MLKHIELGQQTFSIGRKGLCTMTPPGDANFENVWGALEPNVHMHCILCFVNDQENKLKVRGW